MAACLPNFISGSALAGGTPSPTSTGPGPVEVAGHPEPLSLLEDTDPRLAANKRLVFDMWRGIVNAGHAALADELLHEDYIQHSPVLPTGRAAFKAIFSAVPLRPIPELVEPPLLAILAEGNLVAMALVETQPEPGGNGTYTTTHFNLFRVESQRLAEHWHSVQAAPGPNLPPPDAGGPQPVVGRSGEARLELLRADDPTLSANKRAVFDAWQRAEGEIGPRALLAHSFVSRDPNGDGTTPLFPPADAPVVAVMAQEDLVVLVTSLEHPHPTRVGETYTTTWFDMFRLAGGRIAEHWNCATKPGTPPVPYGE